MTNKKRTTEEFIEESLKIHSNRYSYSEADYINNETPIKIICKLHGIFLQLPTLHLLKGCGCPKCIGRNFTFDEWIEKFNKIHNNRYEYISYNNETRKLKIICKIHGEFEQFRFNHMRGSICKECASIKRIHTQFNKSFRSKPEELLKWKRYKKIVYGYSNIEYQKHLTIINPENLKRGNKDYHIDHMYSIRDAFYNNVPPEIVGSYVNLRMISKEENLLKGKKSNITKEELYTLYNGYR
jgi:hypothetical protein